MQLSPFRAQFEATFSPLLGKEPTTLLDDRAAKPLGHQVVAYKTTRGVVLCTVGFARREQRYAHGETPKRVELIAEPSKASLHVAKTLASLGAWMHSEDRPIDVRFKGFEPLRLDAPLYDLTHFLLVPGGDAALPSGEHITLLRVIPADDEEYAHIKMRGDGAARAWWHQHRGDGLLPRRWAPLLRRE